MQWPYALMTASCPTVLPAFQAKTNATIHLSIHRCPTCHLICQSKAGLKSHIISKHPKEGHAALQTQRSQGEKKRVRAFLEQDGNNNSSILSHFSKRPVQKLTEPSTIPEPSAQGGADIPSSVEGTAMGAEQVLAASGGGTLVQGTLAETRPSAGSAIMCVGFSPCGVESPWYNHLRLDGLVERGFGFSHTGIKAPNCEGSAWSGVKTTPGPLPP